MLYLNTFSQLLGVPLWLFTVYFIWEYTWKGLALWKAARKSSSIWFILLLLVNSGGILSILYIYLFSEMKFDDMHDGLKRSAGKRKKR